MNFLKHPLITKSISFLIIFSFLWSNCVYAEVSYLAVDAKTLLNRVLPEAKVLETPLVFHSRLLSENIADLRTMVEKEADIKKRILSEGILKEIDIENCYSMVFKDKSTDARAYYYFNDKGYFYRITDREAGSVNDIFYTAFLARFARPIGDPVELNSYHIERFKVSDENREIINICMKELYGIEVLNKPERIDASIRYYNYCIRVDETWGKNIAGFDGPLTREMLRRAQNKFNPDGTARPYPGVSVLGWVDRDMDGELFGRLADLKAGIGRKMDALMRRRGLVNRLMAFVPDDSFHITLNDLITGNNYKNFYPECSSLSEAQERCRRQVEEAFRELGGIGEIQLVVRGIGAFEKDGPYLLKANVYPKTPEDLDKIERIRAKIREKTGIELPPFSGHITLGYIISEMDVETCREFVGSLKEYKDIELGSFAISEVDFSHFPDMDTYVSHTRLNTVSNEVLTLDTTPGTKSHPAGIGEEGLAREYEQKAEDRWRRFCSKLRGEGIPEGKVVFHRRWDREQGRPIPVYYASVTANVPAGAGLNRKIKAMQDGILAGLSDSLRKKIRMRDPKKLHVTIVIPAYDRVDQPYPGDQIRQQDRVIAELASGVHASSFILKGVAGYNKGIIFIPAIPIYEEGEFELKRFGDQVADSIEGARKVDMYHLTLAYITEVLTPQEAEELIEVLTPYHDTFLERFDVNELEFSNCSDVVDLNGTLVGRYPLESRPIEPGTKSHPAGIGEQGEEDPVARELADKYPTLAGNRDALDNYRFLKGILGDRLDEAIQTAADAVGVTPELVVGGVMGQDLNRINGGRGFMERLSRRDPKKGFAGIISSGGGGAFSSNMVHETRDLAPDEKARIMRAVSQDEVEERGHYIGKNLVAVIDDGGRTGKVLRKLFDIPEWGIFVGPWGDLISVTIWGATDDVITLVYRGSNCFSKININTAGEELIGGIVKEPLASFEKGKQGILDKLVRHIVSSRPGEGYNEAAIIRLITDYLAGELSLSDKETVKKIKAFVKERIKYDGEHEITLTDLMKGTRMRRVFFELGKSFKKKELRLSPVFWFYVTNILNMSRRYDEDFVETGITPLEGISSLNAVQQGAYELCGLYEKGKDGRRATVHPERGLQLFNAAIGSEDVYSTPISYDQATLCGILEAGSFRLTRVVEGKSVNDTFLIGEDEGAGNAYVRPIRYLNLGKLELPITEHLVTEEARSVNDADQIIRAQNTGVDVSLKKASSGSKTEAYIEGRLVKVVHKFIIKFGPGEIILGEVEGEDGKTAVIVGGRIEIIRTDATWHPIRIDIAPGVTLSFKSRLIITQDWVTGNNVDEPHPAPIHHITYKRRIAAINPNTATKDQLKFYFTIDDSLADAVIAYRSQHLFEKVSDLMDVSGIDRDLYNKIQKYVILGREGQQSYDRYEDISEAEWPKADETALSIARQGYVFFTPKGSLFTSLACNMLYPDFVRTLVSRTDLTRVFMAKYKRDVEAAGLTLSEQFQAFLRSIQRVRRGVLKEGDRLYRYIFIPRVADNIRDQIIRDRAKEAEEIRKKKDMGDPSAKVSKVPTDVQLIVVNINTADKTALMLLPHITERLADLIIEYRNTHGMFRDKNEIENIPEIRPLGKDLLEIIKENIILEGDDDLAYFRKQGIIPIIIYNEKKEGYDELQILDLLTFTGERDTLLSLLPPAKRAEVEEREQVFEFRNGDSFWPVTWWDDIFGLTEGEGITVTLDNRYSSTLNIPVDLDESRLYIVAHYLANYIYNRIKAIGSKNVNLTCNHILFEKVSAILNNNFNFDGQGYTITNNIGEETHERIEAGSVFLNVGKNDIGLTYIDENGDIVKTAPSDMVIDMALQAARHGEAGVHGAVNQYITQDGVVRIARRILPGNLRNSDVAEELNKVVLELLSEFLDKEGKLKGIGLTPKEFYSIFDLYEDLQEDKGLAEFINEVGGTGRAAVILGLSADRVNYGNLLDIKEKVKQLVGTHNELAGRIVDKTANKFISNVKDYYKDSRMNTLLLPSSKICLGRILGRRLGEVLTTRLEGMPIDICLEDELSYDMVYRKFLSGDPTAVEVVKVVARYLAVTVEELHNIFGIKRILLSGTPYDNSPGGDFIIGEATGILRQKGLDIEIIRGQGEDRRDIALNRPYRAVVLDIDGVLRKLHRSAVIPDVLIRKICSLVNERAIPIVINSSRGFESINTLLLEKLRRYLDPERQRYVSCYFVEDGKLYLYNLGTNKRQYIKDMPTFTGEQVEILERLVRTVGQEYIRDIAVKGNREKLRIKLKDRSSVDGFVELVNCTLREAGISYVRAVNSGVYCNILPINSDAKKDAVSHYVEFTGIPISEIARIADQVQRIGVDFTSANLSTDKVEEGGEAVGISLKGVDATRWYLDNLTLISPELDLVNSIRNLINNHMPLGAVYKLSLIPKANPYFRYAINIIGSVYTEDVIQELLDKVNELKQIISREEMEALKNFIERIDNTLVNPERISWFMDDLLEDVKVKGLSLEKAMENSQRRLFIGPQEMWAYLIPIINIAGNRPVIFVARNEELRNAWNDLVSIAGGKYKSRLVKLSRKESLGSQINSVLSADELAGPVTGRFWNRLNKVYRSLSDGERRLIDTQLKDKGITNGWNGLKGMFRGRIVGLLADIGIDENIQLYWDNYREARRLKQTFRFALEIKKMEQVKKTASDWKTRNEMLLRHLQSLSSLYVVEVPELNRLNSLVSEFSRLVESGEDFNAIDRIGSEIYSVWLRNVNLIFNSVPPERLGHITRLLLNVVLEDTAFSKEIKDGAVFVDDIVTGGRTMLLSKFFIQAFREGVNSGFIPIVKRNRIPEGYHYYVTQLARLPEDCPDVSSVVYYEERIISGDIPVLAQVTLDKLLAGDYVIPADEELKRYDELLSEEVRAIRSQLPDITLSDRIIKQVIKNCLTGVPERDLKSIYGLMIENYYNPSPVQYAKRKQYRYEIGEVYRFYSNRLTQARSEELIQLATKVKPYEESKIVQGWRRLSEVYRAKQKGAVTKAEGLRSSIVRLLDKYSELRQRSIDLGRQAKDLSPERIAQHEGFVEFIRLHRGISGDFGQLLHAARGQLGVLNTRLMDTPDVLPEGGFASKSDIKRVLNTFGIEDIDRLSIEDIEELIREYNRAIAILQIYLAQSGVEELKVVSSRLRSLLVPPRIEKMDDLIDKIISQSGLEWDREELGQYYIPLAQKIIQRQRESGGRYVVGISGPGGVGKSEFTKRLGSILEIMLGRGKVGIMEQGSYLGENRFVEAVRGKLTEEGREFSKSRAAPRYLNLPYMLGQIRSFTDTGRYEHPVIEKTRETRAQTGLEQREAEEVLLVEGHYLLINDAYNEKYTPDSEWAGYFGELYSAIDLHLFIDADIDVIRQWRAERSVQRGQQKESNERETIKVQKAKEDRKNADIIIEKKEGHRIKEMIEPIRDGSKSHPAGKEEIEDLAGRIISNSGLEWDREQLKGYYIPLALELIARQEESGERYVVGISGPGGVGKGNLAIRLGFVIKEILGEGSVDIMSQDEYFYELSEVEDIKQQLRDRGDTVIPENKGAPRYLDVPNMLGQIQSFRERGTFKEPIVERTKETRRRTGFNDKRADKILLVEGLYLFTDNLYNEKFTPDNEWAGYFRTLYRKMDVHLYVDADLESIKRWKIEREGQGRSPTEMELRWKASYRGHALKARIDKDNADIVVEKISGHAIKRIIWDEDYERGRIRERFGGLPERKRTIHIVGPARSGKTTIAEYISKQLRCVIFNTGDVFRPYTYKAMTTFSWLREKQPTGDIILSRKEGRIFLSGDDITDRFTQELLELINNTTIEYEIPAFGGVKVKMDGVDITHLLHDPIVDANVDVVSKVGIEIEKKDPDNSCRALMKKKAKPIKEKFKKMPILITTGRGFRGDSICRIFVNATPEARARRACIESGKNPFGDDLKEMIRSLRKRDENDRIFALYDNYSGVYDVIDSTHLPVEQQNNEAFGMVEATLKRYKEEWEKQEEILNAIIEDRKQNKEGMVSFLLLKGGQKGGVNNRVRDKILELLKDDFEIHLGAQKAEDLERVFMRWKGALERFIKNLHEESAIERDKIGSLRDAISDNDPWKFERVLLDIQRDLSHKGVLSRRVQRLIMLFKYIKDNETQLVILKRKKSRRDILASNHIGVELARGLLGGRDPFSVDEQDFIKYVIVGPTNAYKALPGMLRYIIYKELTRSDGLLNGVLSEGRRMGLDDKMTMSICNGVHVPGTGELGLETGLIDLDETGAILGFIERMKERKPPSSLIPERRPVQSPDINSYYEARINLPAKTFSIEEIWDLLKREASRLASNLDINTFDGTMQYWLLRKRLDFMLRNISTVTQTMDDGEGFNFYNTLVAIMYLMPYIVEQIPQDGYTNIYLARDSGVLYVAYSLMNRLLERDDRNNHVFHLSRKNIGRKVYTQMRKMVKRANLGNPGNIKEYMDIVMTDFVKLMKEDTEFRQRVQRIYQQLKDSGIVTDSNNRFRVIDTWTGGRLSTYLMAVIRFFNEYDIDAEGNVNRREGRPDYDFTQFIVRPKDETMYKYSQVFDFQRTGLTQEMVEGWYSSMGYECRFTSEGVFRKFMEEVSIQVFTRHYPYGELNLGHRIDWDPLKQRLTYSSTAKQLGALLREIMVMNSVLNFLRHRGTEPSPDARFKKVHLEQGLDSSITANNFLKFIGIQLTSEENKLYEELVSIYNEHYVTESDANQINILVNTAYLVKILGPEVVGFIIDMQGGDPDYHLAIQQVIDSIKRIDYHYFVNVFNSILIAEGTKEKGIELLKRNPKGIAVLLDEASLVYRREPLLQNEFLIKARTQAGLSNIIANGELDELIRASNSRHREDVNRVVNEINGFPRQSVVFWTGPSGSGKTTVARETIGYLRNNGRSVLTLNLDNYYKREGLPRTLSGAVNLETPEAIDWDLVKVHIHSLLAGENVEIYRSKGRTPRTETVHLDDILYIDGLFANHEGLITIFEEMGIPYLTVAVDCVPYLELDSERSLTSWDIRALRRIDRDLGRKSLDRILRRLAIVKEEERRHVLPSLSHADLFINTYEPFDLCFLRNGLLPRLDTNDESVRQEADRLRVILRAIPEINPNISKWREQLEDAKRRMINLREEGLEGPFELSEFHEMTTLIKDALFYNYHDEELFGLLKEGVRSGNQRLKIICAYVLIDIGDSELVTDQDRYEYLSILLEAVRIGVLPRDDSLKDRIDFHVHSYYSDGLRSVAGLVFEAWHRGMAAIAITDHNTFSHMKEVVEVREMIKKVDRGFEVIPGMEINVSDPDYGPGSEHILVYFPIDGRIKGRENRDAFLRWLRTVESNPYIKEIEKYNLWDHNAFLYRLNQLRDVQEGNKGGIGIPPRLLDLRETDFVRLSPHKKFASLVSYALHRKYGLSMQVINEAMKILVFDKKDILGNEEFRTRGYSGARIGDTLEFLRSMGGVVSVAHPKYLVLKKEDTRGIDKATPEGRVSRIRLKMGKLEALFTRYREYLDGIEFHYPEHEDDLLMALGVFINEQNRTRREGEKIIPLWGSDYHHRPGDMETGKIIRQTKLGIGFDEGKKGHILRSIGTNYHVVERIIERAVEKSSTLLGAKRHPTVAERETTSNGYLAEYEGITYLNGAFSVDSSASEKARELNSVLNMALELIQDVVPRRGPPIYIHVKPRHSANVTKDIDTQGGVHLVFDERFIKYFVDPSVTQAYPEDISRILPQVAQWIIAERIGHEFSHDNRIGMPEKERGEEISVILGFDIPFYRRLLENPRLRGEIDMFFRVVRPIFRSGHFYGGDSRGFLGRVAGLVERELRGAVERYVDVYYGFGRVKKAHPTTEEEIIEILKQPTDFRSIAGLNNRFVDLQEYREVKIVFDCGNSIIREYTVKIPRQDAVTDEVIDYIALFIYNRLGMIGARKVFIDDDEIRRAVDERYNIDDKSRPRYRGLLKMRKNLKHVYGVEFEFVSVRPEGTTVIEKEPFSYNKDSGEVIGVDIGKSDIKVVAMKDGMVTYYYKEDWDPGKFDKASQHIGVIKGLIDMAKKEGGLSKPDAIGISVNLVVIDGLVVGSGPMNAGLKEREERKKIRELGKEIAKIYNYEVPVSVLNDGKASSLWANESMGLVNVLGLSLGSGLASGYADKNGDVIDIHGEMGNVVIDIGPDAVGHSMTKMPGASQQYLSQRAVFRLTEKKGLNLGDIPGDTAKLRYIQDLFENGTEEQKQKIKEIYVEIGRYLAAAIAEVSQYLEIENVALFGRVTIGMGGEIIKTSAEIVLRENYPDLNVRIQLPIEPPEDKPRDFYGEFAQAIGASYFANKERQRDRTVGVLRGTKSHPAGIEVGRVKVLHSFQLNDKGQLTGIGERNSYSDTIQGALDKLTNEYDLGLYMVTDQIEVVENLGSALQGQGRAPLAVYVTEDGIRKIKIDEIVFKSPLLVYEELKQEFLKSIVRLIPGSNPAISSVVSTLQNVGGFLKASPEEQDEFLRLLRGIPLLDPDGEYQRLLGRLRMIKGVTDKEIIASIVRYVLKSSVYEGIYDQFGLDRELIVRIRDLDARLDDALQVFTEITSAKQGEELVRQIGEAEGLAIKVIKTFKGIRIDGLSRLDKKLAGIIAASVKVASKTDEIAGLPLAMTEGQYYIVVDKYRVTEEMEEAIRRLEKNNVFKVVYTVPEDYDLKKIIHLIDPADLKEDMQKGILYLPMPYLRSSLYMAAAIVSAGGEIDNINPLVTGLISDLYSQLLGRPITKKDLQDLFTAPWLILPEIRGVIGEINNLRKALTQIEKAA